jgi:SAM-dependent methyltransferase
VPAFDRAAEIYDQTRGLPPGVGDKVAAALIDFAQLKPDDPILEVGVGTGRIAIPLARALGSNHRLSGVDLARKMMAQLVAKLSPETHPPILVEADALHLPFPAGLFRAILTVHVWHLLREWQAVLAEIVRVRAPNGCLVVGWNDHLPESSGERINQKFREIALAHGISVERQGLVNFDDLAAQLPGARRSEIVAAEWTIERAPRLALQSIAERHFSSAWLVPDDLFPALLVDLDAWANKEWPDLDRAIPEQRRFKWMKIDW